MARIRPEIRLEQVLVALADDLGEEVVGAGGDHDVVDLVQRGERVGDRLERPRDPDPDHRLAGEAELERVGDRDDLHDAAVDQALHALAHRGLGQADHLADGGVRASAVLLQLLDDRLGDVVERDGGALAACGSCAAWFQGRAGRSKILLETHARDFVAKRFRTDRIPCGVPGAFDRIRAIRTATPRRAHVHRSSGTRSRCSQPDPRLVGEPPRAAPGRLAVGAGARRARPAVRLRHRVAGRRAPTAARARTCPRTTRSWSSPTGRSTSTSTGQADARPSRSSRSRRASRSPTTPTSTTTTSSSPRSRTSSATASRSGRDIIVLTDWMAARMIGLGLDPEARPRQDAQRPGQPDRQPARRPTWDPRTATTASRGRAALTGIAYNAKYTGEVRSFEELMTRADLKGKISLLTEMRDTMLFMLLLERGRPGGLHEDEWAGRPGAAGGARRLRPGPPVHRQRLHPRPERRQHRGLRGLVRRRHRDAVRQPRHQVGRARGGPRRSGRTT